MVDRVTRRRVRVQQAIRPGAEAGSLKAPEGAAATTIQLIAYGPDAFVERGISSPAELEPILGEHPVLWVNVSGLRDVAVLEEIGRIFGLHHLALEDALNLWQHPKIEEYGGNVFVVMRTVEDVGELATEQFAVGFGKGFVVTFQEREGDPLESVRRRLRQGVGRIRGWGADYLAYAIIDAVVDDYYLHLERLGDRLEALEPRAMGRPDRLLMRDIQRLHHDVQAMARIARPLQEALVELSRDPTPLIEPRVRPFLRDCCDHVKQILGMIDGYREAEVSLKSLTLSALTHRMNEVIRLLAVISTIFAPLTFIVGIYGMNFDPSSSPWNMPELRWYWGYPFSFGLMGLAAAGVLTYFARKGWLAPEELSEPPPAAPPKQRN